MNLGPGCRALDFSVVSVKKKCKVADQVVECADCEKRFHASCANRVKEELQGLDSGSESWYCWNCTLQWFSS